MTPAAIPPLAVGLPLPRSVATGPPREGWTFLEAGRAWWPFLWQRLGMPQAEERLLAIAMMQRSLAAAFARGEAVVRARPAADPLAEPRPIPPDVWAAGALPVAVPLDLPGVGLVTPGCIVTPGAGVTFIAGRVLPAERREARPRLDLARAWMRKRAARGPLKRDDAIERCQRETNCSRDEARAAWRELPAESRPRRGRPRA